jgi:hypothetical protein
LKTKPKILDGGSARLKLRTLNHLNCSPSGENPKGKVTGLVEAFNSYKPSGTVAAELGEYIFW